MTLGDDMDLVIYGLIIFIAICFLVLWYATIYNKFQNYIIRINEAEASIDSTLRKRFDLLNKSISIIKANTDIEGEIFEDIIKLRSRKLTNFDLDRKLYEGINEFEKIKEVHPNLKKCDNFIKIELSLNESEAEIVASRRYYNDIITDYNKIIRTFPSNIVAKLCGYKQKTYFDGKDMTDDKTNDFKL